MTRSLYLICYDITEPKRLAKIGRYLKKYKIDGQKSVIECWVTHNEFQRILYTLQDLMQGETDQIHVFQLDHRSKPQYFTRTRHFEENAFFIF